MKLDCETTCKEVQFLTTQIDRINNKLDKILDKMENNQNRTTILETIQAQQSIIVKDLSKDLDKIKIDAAKVSVVIGIIATVIGITIKLI